MFFIIEICNLLGNKSNNNNKNNANGIKIWQVIKNDQRMHELLHVTDINCT